MFRLHLQWLMLAVLLTCQLVGSVRLKYTDGTANRRHFRPIRPAPRVNLMRISREQPSALPPASGQMPASANPPTFALTEQLDSQVIE